MQKLLIGKAKYPADRDYDSKIEGAPRYTSLKVDVEGREIVVYCNEGTEDYKLAKSFRKGDTVRLAEDKGKYKLVAPVEGETTQASAPAEPTKPRQIDPEQAKHYALTYAAVYKALEDKLGLTVPAEIVQDAASTVFIALTKG